MTNKAIYSIVAKTKDAELIQIKLMKSTINITNKYMPPFLYLTFGQILIICSGPVTRVSQGEGKVILLIGDNFAHTFTFRQMAYKHPGGGGGGEDKYWDK